MEEKQTCGSCFYAREHGQGFGQPYLLCCRHAPTSNWRGYSHFPPVEPHFWCGEWRTKQEAIYGPGRISPRQ